jgi:hypothetical protein
MGTKEGVKVEFMLGFSKPVLSVASAESKETQDRLYGIQDIG